MKPNFKLGDIFHRPPWTDCWPNWRNCCFYPWAIGSTMRFIALPTGKVSPLDIRTSRSSKAFDVDWFETTTQCIWGELTRKVQKTTWMWVIQLDYEKVLPLSIVKTHVYYSPRLNLLILKQVDDPIFYYWIVIGMLRLIKWKQIGVRGLIRGSFKSWVAI